VPYGDLSLEHRAGGKASERAVTGGEGEEGLFLFKIMRAAPPYRKSLKVVAGVIKKEKTKKEGTFKDLNRKIFHQKERQHKN